MKDMIVCSFEFDDFLSNEISKEIIDEILLSVHNVSSKYFENSAKYTFIVEQVLEDCKYLLSNEYLDECKKHE